MNPLGSLKFFYSLVIYPDVSQEKMRGMPLPQEIFEKVLSFAEPADKQSAVLVNKLWRSTVINASRSGEYQKFESFTDRIIAKLDPKYSKKIRKIQILVEEKRILNSETLINVKENLHQLKEDLISLLKGVGEEDLNALKGISSQSEKPLFFERPTDLVDIVNIHLTWDRAKGISDLWRKSNALQEVVRGFIVKKELKKAFQTASDIPDERIRSNALWEVMKDFISKKNFGKAFQVAIAIPDEWSRTQCH